MNAELKSVFSLEQHDLDLEVWVPDPIDFGIKLMLFIGAAGDDKSDAFDILLCTPNWFLSWNSNRRVIVANWVWFVRMYDYRVLVDEVRARCAACVGSSWFEVAKQVDTWAAWEFRGQH